MPFEPSLEQAAADNPTVANAKPIHLICSPHMGEISNKTFELPPRKCSPLWHSGSRENLPLRRRFEALSWIGQRELVAGKSLAEPSKKRLARIPVASQLDASKTCT
jgi:hypothetical protein